MSERDTRKYSLQAFTDADYASKASDRGSVSGEAIMCGGAMCVCFSRMLQCVGLFMS